MATIKDVAALAGVSTATVSLVLNGRGQELKVSCLLYTSPSPRD